MAKMVSYMAFLPLAKNCARTSILTGRTSARRKLTMALKGELKMVKLGLFVRFEAKPGKEKEVESFLKQALEMANQEKTTVVWFALRLGPSTFAISDGFADEAGRQTHLNGPIAKALFGNAPNLFVAEPTIEKTEILGAKY
jgi:quinol monooxygenase YgiN